MEQGENGPSPALACRLDTRDILTEPSTQAFSSGSYDLARNF